MDNTTTNTKSNMKTFTDYRGTIEDLKEGQDWSVTYISFKKGAVRGNHYHKDTVQFDIVIHGILECVTKGLFFKRARKMYGMDTKFHWPWTKHAYKALTDSEMISICFGKRIGENYEKDTFKLATPLI
mgnify:CR=1 FL=1